jgi:predicted protein tyrosine phosphatase
MMINKWEGDYKCVLMVCSAGLLRSPTAAEVGREFGWNTRAAGAYEEYALIPVTAPLIMWANLIVCMKQEHADVLQSKFAGLHPEQKIVILDIEDNHAFRDPELVAVLRHKLKELNV